MDNNKKVIGAKLGKKEMIEVEASLGRKTLSVIIVARRTLQERLFALKNK